MSKGSDRIAVFVGPSACGMDELVQSLPKDRFSFFPPIKRGDLEALPRDFTVIVVVDGLFNSVPAVGHVELRKKLEYCTVYGCSSMGAIRAFEMRGHGMI